MEKQPNSALRTAMQIASDAVDSGELDFYLVEVKPCGLMKILGFKDGARLPAPIWEEM